MSRYSETSRQIVHVAMVGFAFLLRDITWVQAALLAGMALAFNAFVLPGVAPGILRPSDRAGSARAGVLFYPLSVLLLILTFRERLDIVAAAWAIMAFGDGVATLAGTRIPGPRLPWNPDKSWAGMLSGAGAGAAGAMVLSAWVAPGLGLDPDHALPLWVLVVAAGGAALVESIPARLDDNLSVPFAAGALLWLGAMTDPAAARHFVALAMERLPIGVLLNALMATSAWSRGSLTVTGSVVGSILGTVIYIGTGLAGWLLLFGAFAIAVITSRLGLKRKEAMGIAEERGGRRGAGNALANCLVGAAGAYLVVVTGTWWAPIVFITGLVAGASDTVSSEIGKAFGGTPRLFPSGRAVPAGTPGAVSAIGTLAGILAAACLALPAADALIGMPDTLPAAGAIVTGATGGAFIESALAVRFEADGILTNDLLNFLNTASAAVIAVAAFVPLSRVLA